MFSSYINDTVIWSEIMKRRIECVCVFEELAGRRGAFAGSLAEKIGLSSDGKEYKE